MLPIVGTSLSVHEGYVHTFEQMTVEAASQVKKRQKRSVEEKRRIVEETLAAGASVARVARRHAVNANQVFYWRKKYREGLLGKSPSGKLLPVTGAAWRMYQTSSFDIPCEIRSSVNDLRGLGRIQRPLVRTDGVVRVRRLLPIDALVLSGLANFRVVGTRK
jgi:transposase-like protein